MKKLKFIVQGKEMEIEAEETSTPTLVTIPGVEIVRTGTYDLMSGKVTFTSEDLAAAVAAQDDVAIPSPRLKIGHTSEFGDGEPCFGVARNLRVNATGDTLLGDYVDVPGWLATIMQSAYPSRSIEGKMNVVSASGRTHRMIIENVALLGVTLPGVKTLQDLATMYGAEVPEGTEVQGGVAVAASIPNLNEVQASVNLEDVRRGYYDTLNGPRSDWWWITEVRLDPNELIVMDEENGVLYRVPFSVSGEEVTYDDPIEVEVQYIDASAARKTINGSRVVAAYSDRDESRNLENQEQTMDPKIIREKLGLAEDATDEEVTAALDKAGAAVADTGNEDPDPNADPANADPANTDPANANADPANADPANTDPANTPADAEPVAASDGTVRIDAKVWEETVNQAREGAAARQEQLTERRERILTAAVDDGKIAPASKDAWRKKLKAAQEETEKELDSLTPGLLPVKETSVEGSSDAQQDSYDPGLFPEVGASSSSSSDPITKESK